MLDETGLRDLADEAPLVELLLELADEMDSGAALKVRSQYLAALKDARRVLAAAPGSAGASKAAAEPIAAVEETAPEASKSDEAVTDFARFKQAKGGAAAG